MLFFADLLEERAGDWLQTGGKSCLADRCQTVCLSSLLDHAYARKLDTVSELIAGEPQQSIASPPANQQFLKIIIPYLSTDV